MEYVTTKIENGTQTVGAPKECYENIFHSMIISADDKGFARVGFPALNTYVNIPVEMKRAIEMAESCDEKLLYIIEENYTGYDTHFLKNLFIKSLNKKL